MTSSAMLVPGKALDLVNHVKLRPLEPRFCGRARGGLQGAADPGGGGVAEVDVPLLLGLPELRLRPPALAVVRVAGDDENVGAGAGVLDEIELEHQRPASLPGVDVQPPNQV